jgi:UDP-N-acetyl-2-amino-2-deoxyglucuronate dehydrogenase
MYADSATSILYLLDQRIVTDVSRSRCPLWTHRSRMTIPLATVPRTVGLGIIGCGGAAADVARAVVSVPGVAVTGVCCRDLAAAEALAGPLGATGYATLDGMLAAAAVDAVYVAVPHDLLAPLAAQVLDAGRHVLVEKPAALSLDALDGLAELAARQRRTLGVFYEMRFAPVVLEAARLVRDGAIGRITAVRIRTIIDKPFDYWSVGLSGRSINPWRGQSARAGGGVVLMNSSHQLDIVAAITGLSVRRVFGIRATNVPGIDVEDTAAGVLSYSDGAVGSLVAGAHVPGATDGETIEIDGDAGQVVLEPYARQLRVYLRRPWAELPAGQWLEPEVGTGDQFAAALRAFTEAALSGTRPPVGAPEARAVLATILGLYRSSAEGRAVDLG